MADLAFGRLNDTENAPRAGVGVTPRSANDTLPGLPTLLVPLIAKSSLSASSTPVTGPVSSVKSTVAMPMRTELLGVFGTVH